MFVSHPPSAYDLFLTAAMTDGIKLWDLRTNRCVRRYDGHVNRSHPVGVALSPCARFIASGSEDRSVMGRAIDSNNELLFVYAVKLTGEYFESKHKNKKYFSVSVAWVGGGFFTDPSLPVCLSCTGLLSVSKVGVYLVLTFIFE